jgi:hypothetical protein
MNTAIQAYNDSLPEEKRTICQKLAELIDSEHRSRSLDCPKSGGELPRLYLG